MAVRYAMTVQLCACRSDFHSSRPILVAVEPSKLKVWEGEWAFWGAPGTYVTSYTGSTAARTAIHDFEMFLAPGCLDGKAPKRIKDEIAAKVVVSRIHAHLPVVLHCWHLLWLVPVH